MRTPVPADDVQPHLFGPLRSRRLGLSLGVDIIPRKVCSLDCIYCEVGRTTRYAVAPKPYYGVSQVAAEIAAALALRPDIEWVTFSGSGEPTLNALLGDMIREVRKRTATPVAVITNGTLLWIEEVRRRLLEADAVLPSLDAATQAAFQRINKPDPLLDISVVIEGLKTFRKEYRGKLLLEILFVRGVNDADEDVLALKKAVGEIRPDKIHLNTVVRPPAEAWALPVDPRRMREIAGIIGHGCEIIAAAAPTEEGSSSGLDAETILRLLARRPMKAEELLDSFHAEEETLEPLLDELLADGMIVRRVFAQEEFFALRGGE